MIRGSQKTVSLAISEKLNTTQKLQVCKPEEIDILITELDPSDSKLSPYIQKGIMVL